MAQRACVPDYTEVALVARYKSDGRRRIVNAAEDLRRAMGAAGEDTLNGSKRMQKTEEGRRVVNPRPRCCDLQSCREQESRRQRRLTMGSVMAHVPRYERDAAKTPSGQTALRTALSSSKCSAAAGNRVQCNTASLPGSVLRCLAVVSSRCARCSRRCGGFTTGMATGSCCDRPCAKPSASEVRPSLRQAPPRPTPNPDINASLILSPSPAACLSSPGPDALAWRPSLMRCSSSSTSTSAISRASTQCVAPAWPRTLPATKSRADPLQRKDELEYWLTEHLRLNGLYWGLTALHLLRHPDALPRAGILDFVFSCLHESGGFGAAPGHDAHMLYTVSGVQILATLDAFGELEERVQGGRQKIGQCASVSPRRRGSHAHDSQLSPTCRTPKQAPLQAMSGENETHASYTVHSMPCRSWVSYTW